MLYKDIICKSDDDKPRVDDRDAYARACVAFSSGDAYEIDQIYREYVDQNHVIAGLLLNFIDHNQLKFIDDDKESLLYHGLNPVKCNICEQQIVRAR